MSVDAILAMIDDMANEAKEVPLHELDVPEDDSAEKKIHDLEALEEIRADQAANEAEPEQEFGEAGTPADDTTTFEMPPKEYVRKGQRFTLLFQGVCTHCAHCGQPLSDSVSIERGIGPVCSKKGYLEDPTDPDEMQAMIDLAEYPDLVQYLTDHYKPQGVRGLMNGLVKICSLNRRSPVHQACCDAVESLGYKRLASLLRESIAIIEVKDSDEYKDCFHVWVKKSEWSWNWTNALRRIPGTHFSRAAKGTIVPKSQKRALWDIMLQFYEGFCAKVPGEDGKGTKTVKLARKAS